MGAAVRIDGGRDCGNVFALEEEGGWRRVEEEGGGGCAASFGVESLFSWSRSCSEGICLASTRFSMSCVVRGFRIQVREGGAAQAATRR